MKKAKIMLASVATVAIVGGAFAFKAHRSQQVIYTSTVANECTIAVTTALTSEFNSSPVTYNTTQADACPFNAFLTDED